MSEWISVEERLPEVGDWRTNHVLTVNDMGRFRVAYYDGSCWRTPQDREIGWLSPVTHWQPIPSPPGEEVDSDGSDK